MQYMHPLLQSVPPSSSRSQFDQSPSLDFSELLYFEVFDSFFRCLLQLVSSSFSLCFFSSFFLTAARIVMAAFCWKGKHAKPQFFFWITLLFMQKQRWAGELHVASTFLPSCFSCPQKARTLEASLSAACCQPRNYLILVVDFQSLYHLGISRVAKRQNHRHLYMGTDWTAAKKPPTAS